MKIAFHSNQLCLRGTEIALYGYAKHNKEVLNNESIILSSPHANMDALPKFKQEFDVNLMNFGSYEQFLHDNNVDYLYVIKAGDNDGLCLSSIPTLVHSVFRNNHPHGHRYAYVSDWLARDQGYDPEQYSVPHIVEPLPYPNEDLKERLSIPKNARIFGCYAGTTEFNIGFVHETIARLVEKDPHMYFIFMNINKFIDHKQVKFLDGTYDLQQKSNFVHTCDAMLHARTSGETFGLAVGEFAISGKPIITYANSPELAHLEIMGDRAVTYKDAESLENILMHPREYKGNTVEECYKKFSPEQVMKKFDRVFLQ